MEVLAKIMNGFQPFIIFAKSLILVVWLGSEDAWYFHFKKSLILFLTLIMTALLFSEFCVTAAVDEVYVSLHIFFSYLLGYQKFDLVALCIVWQKSMILVISGCNNMFKVNNRNTRTRCEICSELTIKTPKRRHWCRCGVFIVNFGDISHLVLVFLLLTLGR